MKFKVKNKKDGTFRCWTASGREVSGEYHFHPHASKPAALYLFAMVTDPTGQPKAVIKTYDVTTYIDAAELRELAENVARRAEAIERGDPAPDHVQQVDIRETNTWQRFLKNNPDFLRQHPHYLSDLRAAADNPLN